MEIGFAALRGLDVRRLARPHLEALSRQLGETVHLLALEGGQCRFLDSVESMATVRVSSRAGWALPAHSTSGGKILLSALSRDARDRLFPKGRLAGLTARTTTTRQALEAELDAVASRGYATNFEESEVGLSAVAVMIRDPDSLPLAAISVSAPAARLPEERVLEYVDAARQAAAAIEFDLRSRPTGSMDNP
jgi:DNA-binding IclR family transcriptional regulator